MNAKLAAEAESLYQTATRLSASVDRRPQRPLSPEHRRAAFALQCPAANCSEEEEEPKRAPIGFAYPNAR
jgi:hypothetical protein